MFISSLLKEVRSCTICSDYLPLGPRPVFQFHHQARILVVGQAPGRKVHKSGIPFADASGKRLREWLGLSSEVFYDPQCVAILPMSFCYPGTSNNGDLPPRPECAPAWREKLITNLENLRITMVIGQYAQAHYLPNAGSVTNVVLAWQKYWPNIVPLPHPSPRNNMWFSRNPWFEAEFIPLLKQQVKAVLKDEN